MKTALVLIAILMSKAAFANLPVDQYKTLCTGQLEVLKTSDPTYSPGLPPHGRSGGIAPSAGFIAYVEFHPLGEGCPAFLKKYQLSALDNSFEIPVAALATGDLASTKKAAAEIIGQSIPVQWMQYFYYSYGKVLPFYPQFMNEDLILAGNLNQQFSVQHYFTVDTLQTYGIPSLSQLSDAQLVSLAKDIVNFDLAEVQKPGWVVPFVNLLTEIEPASFDKKVEYLHTLISLFQSLNPDKVGGASFFEFYIGGSSGQPIAAKINSLAVKTNALTEAELQSLTFQFPSMLLIGYPDGQEEPCATVTADILEQNLQNWLAAPALNYQQKDGALNVAGSFIGKPGTFQFCLNKFNKNAEIVALSGQVYEKWKKDH